MVHSNSAAIAAQARSGDTSVAVTYRDLFTIEECAAVWSLEREIWDPEHGQAVPPPLLKAAVQRGGTLVGAFDERERLVGFAFSIPGSHRGRHIHWSYKLGVLSDYRSAGVGGTLKRLQRDRVLDRGIDVIEWTFDPLLATNAHLNCAKLGVFADEYEEDFYGDLVNPAATRGQPTDRLIAVWELRSSRVLHCVARLRATLDDGSEGELLQRIPSGAVAVNRTTHSAEFLQCAECVLDLDAELLTVDIPTTIPLMSVRAPGLVLEWRRAIRQIFSAYLPRGYRVIDFLLDRPNARGTYVLVRHT